MTMKRKVTFHDDVNISHPSDDDDVQKAKKLRCRRRRRSSETVDDAEGQHQVDPLLWYSSLELRAVCKNAALSMGQHEDEYQNREMRNHLLHRSFRENPRRNSGSNNNQDGDSDNNKSSNNKNGHQDSADDPPYDERAAQTILNIWTSGDLRFGVASSPEDDCRRGMENLCSSRLAVVRRKHRKRAAVCVLLAQQHYGRQDDRIAQVSRVCSSSSRRFAELMGKADGMAAAHIHLMNLEEIQQQQQQKQQQQDRQLLMIPSEN